MYYNNLYYRNQPNDRFVGALLPFLAGVAVTTPFVFFAKNQNQPYYYPPYPPMPYYQPYPVYPIYR